MPKLNAYEIAAELVLGSRYNDRVPRSDQERQRTEVQHILTRLRVQPGVILADEVGMGKTFVALAVVYCIASRSKRGPAIIMVPPNLIDKWEQDLKTFCELYLDGPHPVNRDTATPGELRSKQAFRYGVARHSVELMKLLDDPPRSCCHVIFLGQGAMARRQSDKWIRLALIREALRRHGRGGATQLIKVKKVIHRFLADLLHAIGEQSASTWGEDVWRDLLKSDPMQWKDIYNATVRESRELTDDPVPKAVVSALNKGLIDLKPLAVALEGMPLRSMSRDSDRQRIAEAREALKQVEAEAWKELLAQAKWRSPLLVMDEAHHLKNPATSLARQLQSPDSEDDLKTGDGAMAKAFDRMLFLTATPFQLGHQELIRVLERFGDVKWDKAMPQDLASFQEELQALSHSLTESQRTAILLQKCWTRLRSEELPSDGNADEWWASLQGLPADQLTPRHRALLDAYDNARKWRAEAEGKLKPWIVRHNKGDFWSGTEIARRARLHGASMLEAAGNGIGLEVPPSQLLPFFLAARSAVAPGKDLLGEALCSSYEAFRQTRLHRTVERDEHEYESDHVDLTHSTWYLSEFDTALEKCSGRIHPKIAATIQKAVDLWENGEKVLVFAFYRHTCRALRLHISEEIERRIISLARRRFAGAGRPHTDAEIDSALESIQRRFMDDPKSPARRALDRALYAIVDRRSEGLVNATIIREQRDQLVEIMRRFLRVNTTLVRCFPIHEHDSLEPHLAIRSMLDKEDGSGLSWRAKFEGFIDFLIDRCSSAQRDAYLDAAMRTQTGAIRVTVGEHANDSENGNATDDTETAMTLANVQLATGETKREHRSRLMRAFNTPFFPDIFVCSEVMGEGVDLQRYCRYVIHHDLAWNPSQIEQRTGRIDRLGCKAENKHPIHIYLPYLAGASDERQYRVMSDREQWFRIVMGQDEVAKLIPDDADHDRPPLPASFSEGLSFNLGLE